MRRLSLQSTGPAPMSCITAPMSFIRFLDASGNGTCIFGALSYNALGSRNGFYVLIRE